MLKDTKYYIATYATFKVVCDGELLLFGQPERSRRPTFHQIVEMLTLNSLCGR